MKRTARQNLNKPPLFFTKSPPFRLLWAKISINLKHSYFDKLPEVYMRWYSNYNSENRYQKTRQNFFRLDEFEKDNSITNTCMIIIFYLF